jgi:methylated-DNA-[protein]-cysteine S-methyltransferase
MQDNSNFCHLIFETDFGYAGLIFREKPFILSKVLLPRTSKKLLLECLEKAEWGKAGSNEKARRVSESIIAYFKGNVIQPCWEWMDMSGLTALEKTVLLAVADIPHGETRTYKNIAETVSRPKAYRFVGATLAKNPFPILIPCHRVVKSDGSVGQFGGGTEQKRKMIELEARH